MRNTYKIIFVLITIITTTIFDSCKSKKDTLQEIANRSVYYQSYIEGFTVGEVSSDAEIVVRLNFDYADSTKIQKPENEKLFSFDPKIEGTTTWIDSKTVKFKPNKKLESGKTYISTFNLDKIVNVPDTLEEFKFFFKVINQNFEIKVDGYKPYSDNDLKWNQITGVVKTLDNEKVENIEKMLTVEQNGKKLSLKIVAENSRKFLFIIDSAVRVKEESVVKIKYDGQFIEVDKKDKIDFRIPSIDKFEILGVKTQIYPEKLIRVIFSDPLDAKQDLIGKIFYGEFFNYNYSIKSNELFIYPLTEMNDQDDFEIDKKIKSITGKVLSASYKTKLVTKNLLPDIKFESEGSILPSTNESKIGFEAVNLKFIDVKITKIYQNNILQFLQVNKLSTKYQLTRVGKEVLRKTVQIGEEIEPNEWKKYYLDINNLITREPGAIYNIEISFKPNYTIFDCPNINKMKEISDKNEVDNSKFSIDDINYPSGYYYSDYDYDYYYDDYYYDYDYDQQEGVDDFCKKLKYKNKTISQNILASDVGIAVKISENKQISIFVNNIVHAQPISDAKIEIYNYQMQKINAGTTNSEGYCVFDLKDKPFVVVASQGHQQSYIRLSEENLLSMSNFDVSGEKITSGAKGFIYTERGVWRPGDSIFVTLILRDEKIVKNNHPIIFELYNPLGNLIEKRTIVKNLNGFYAQSFVTSPEAQTGNYVLRITAGSNVMDKTLKIEAIKPNRLKIDISTKSEIVYSDIENSITLKSQWLHGAIASDYNYSMYISYSRTKTTFTNFPKYNFDDITKNVSNEKEIFSEGNLDENGQTTINANAGIGDAPGFLKGTLETRVYEPGGEYSTDFYTLTFSPFTSYVGILSPIAEKQPYLYTDSTYYFKIVNVSEKGKAIENNEVNVEIYKMDWHYWWDYNDYGSDFVYSSNLKIYNQQKVKITNGKGNAKISIAHSDWGRYLIKITDPVSKHTTSIIQYFDWYGYTRTYETNKYAASMLQLSLNKNDFKVGEEIKLFLKAPAGSRAYITIENGTKILKTFTVEEKNGEINFKVKASQEMLPNAYLFVHLLQPHKFTVNGLPLRMYGVVNFNVEDPNTHLKPIITCNEVLRPNEQATISIKEETGKPMTYTLAIVDDGLLNLTRFKTPDPYSRFFAREALGVKTWDIYNDVIGAIAGQMQKIFAIGGDEEGGSKSNSLKANRFKPFVTFIGPFECKSGKTNQHKIQIPNYFGSARIMVVAAQDNSFGNSEKNVIVRSPLILLGTAPRVVGPGEQFSLPALVFANEKNIKDVTITIETNDLLKPVTKTQKLSFSKTGEKTANFNVKVADKIGIGKIKVVAQCGNEKAEWTIEIDVRAQNPEIVKTQYFVLKPNENINIKSQPIGLNATNSNILEVSSFVPLNLSKWLNYLFYYPHGCAEQTTSGAFPLLYSKELSFSPDIINQRIEDKINFAIKKIQSLQTETGGVSMWPGYQYPDDWVTSYAGHFIIEAKTKGFIVSDNFIKKWKQHQQNKVRTWRTNKSDYNDDYVQAYRLYTLALAGEPDFGAMNYLSDQKNLVLQTYWMLAAAYAIAGRDDLAKNIIKSIPPNTKQRFSYYSYGSYERDLAFRLEIHTRLNQKEDAFNVLNEISKIMSNNNWLSTQEAGQLIRSVALYVKKYPISNETNFDLTRNSKSENFKTQNLLQTIKLESDKTEQIKLKNNSKGTLYARLIQKGIPSSDANTVDYNNNIEISVRYVNENSVDIKIDSLKQGTIFYAITTIRNPGNIGYYSSLALTQIIPSGWEVLSDRYAVNNDNTNSEITYQDIRDDRVLSYFNLSTFQTITIKTRISATYAGTFYLPGIYCEAMYDNRVKAFVKGKWVKVLAY